MRDELTIRVRPVDAPWRPIGSYETRGVWCEDALATANMWGPDTLDFTLKRSSIRHQWGELAPDAWVEALVGGREIWGGRIFGAPIDETSRTLTINCRGWQYHLDDDQQDRIFVRQSTRDFTDVRATYGFNAVYNLRNGVGDVELGQGIGMMMRAAGVAITAGQRVGVILDVGQWNIIRRVEIPFLVRGTPNANFSIGVGMANSAEGSVSEAAAATLAASGTLNFNATGQYRYLVIYLENTSGVSQTPAADVGVNIQTPLIATSSSYLSAGTSILKASQVLIDMLPYAPLLDQYTGYIDDSAFAIPEFTSRGLASIRSIVAGAFGFTSRQVRVDLARRVQAFSRDTVATVVAQRRGFELEGAGVTADDTINQYIVEALDSVGRLVHERVSTPEVNGNVYRQQAVTYSGTSGIKGSAGPSNGDFETGSVGSSPPSGWTLMLGSGACPIVNTPVDTGNKAVEIGRAAGTGIQQLVQGLVPGRRYKIVVRVRRDATATGDLRVGIGRVQINPATVFVAATTITGASMSNTAYSTFTLEFDAPGKIALLQLEGLTGVFTSKCYVDNVFFYEADYTGPDRWRFNRARTIPTRNTQTAGVGGTARKIGQVALAEQNKGALRGAARAWPGGLRERSGQLIHPSDMLTRVGIMLLLPDRTDPDTGGLGQIVRAVNARYTHSQRLVELDLDNSSNAFDAFMERLDAVATALGGGGA